ncbi:MAG: SH3 domain-containing protein [Chloroflexi bacterium]|nr:SH3 domain-containing protein [Chloroflexota bacterium]
MKKRFLMGAIVVLALLVGMNIAFAQGGAQLQAVTTGAASLYAEPSAAGEAVAELPASTELTVLSATANGAWLEVEAADGSAGFVAVEDVAVLDLLPLAAQGVIVSDQAGAGLYAQPNFSADFVGSLTQGDTATILAQSGEWAYVETGDGTRAWTVASSFETLPAGARQALVDAGANPELGIFAEPQINADIATTVPTGEMVTVLGESDAQWSEVMTVDGTTGYALSSSLIPLPNTFVTAEVDQAMAGIYAEPDFAAELITELPNGASMTLISLVDDFWAEVFHPAFGTGYALRDTLGGVYTVAVVPSNNAIVRAGPNESLYRPIAELPAGSEVVVLGKSANGAWVQVAIPFSEVDFPQNGVIGWMRDFLFRDAAGQTPFDMDLLSVTE